MLVNILKTNVFMYFLFKIKAIFALKFKLRKLRYKQIEEEKAFFFLLLNRMLLHVLKDCQKVIFFKKKVFLFHIFLGLLQLLLLASFQPTLRSTAGSSRCRRLTIRVQSTRDWYPSFRHSHKSKIHRYFLFFHRNFLFF